MSFNHPLWAKLTNRFTKNTNPSENTPSTSETPNEHNIVHIRNDAVLLAPTDVTREHFEGKGAYFPEEQDELISKILPTQATVGAAGIDLKAFFLDEELGEDKTVTLQCGETKLIKTGFKWAIPPGYVGMVCSRSGLALKYGVFVLNAPGIIDSDYRGDVGVILHNTGKNPIALTNGDRVAQMVIIKTSDLPIIRAAEIDVSETTRGTNGFGSTGKA